jgi:spermidine synthase
MEPGEVIARDRNFFGTLRVVRTNEDQRLLHGRTMHGAQLLAAQHLDMPTMYYSHQGPVGDVFATLMSNSSEARIAAVGLGAGTIVCYAKPGEQWDLFEINPAVVEIARDPQLFQFLGRCAPTATFIVADGRRALQSMENARYDLIVLDAFSSDAIPAHLLTREAFAMYLQRLAPGGIIAVHVSNRYLALEPVVAANAAALNVPAFVRDDPSDGTPGIQHAASTWIVLSPDARRLEPLSRVRAWRPLVSTPGFRPWTDDYTNLLSVVRALR